MRAKDTSSIPSTSKNANFDHCNRIVPITERMGGSAKKPVQIVQPALRVSQLVTPLSRQSHPTSTNLFSDHGDNNRKKLYDLLQENSTSTNLYLDHGDNNRKKLYDLLQENSTSANLYLDHGDNNLKKLYDLLQENSAPHFDEAETSREKTSDAVTGTGSNSGFAQKMCNYRRVH